MNTFAHPKKRINESIGGLDAESILRLACVSITDLENQWVMDVGAGLSSLLETIGVGAKSRIAVDPIYTWWESKAIEHMRNSLKEYVQQAIFSPTKDPITKALQDDSIRQMSEVERYSRDSNIQYFGDISDVPKDALQDTIFISSVLYAIDKPKKLLSQMDALLSAGGTIIITDFTSRSDIYRKIQEAGIAIVSTQNQYFCAKLKKGEWRKLTNDPILILGCG